MLPKAHFNQFIRIIRRSDIAMVTQIRSATFVKLKALGVKRDLAKAITKTPAGSDQVDIRSIINWIEGIKPGQKEDINQLVAIDATAVARG